MEILYTKWVCSVYKERGVVYDVVLVVVVVVVATTSSSSYGAL